ncbi:MAG: hypothetical protein IPI42_08700 [Saprospiraceae bacterium]|nr:hypothetical protein [Candidatus Parvibacillus calidus]
MQGQEVKASVKQDVIELETKNRRENYHRKVVSQKHTDYILKVASQTKKLKEQSMSDLFEQRFEQP